MAGTFYGYRALAPVAGGGMHAWRFFPPDPVVGLEYWNFELGGPVTFWYANHRGTAEDEYPDDFVFFPTPGTPGQYSSRLIIATIRDNPCLLTLTYDGINAQPERRFDRGFARLEAARGFKIKNAERGSPCRYQLIPML